MSLPSRALLSCVSFLALLLFLSSSLESLAADRCSPHLKPTIDRILALENVSAESERAFTAVNQALLSGSLDRETLSQAFSLNLKPKIVAKLTRYDIHAFDRFYRRLFELLNPETLAELSESAARFSYDVIQDSGPWIRFLEPDTIAVLVEKLAKTVRVNKSRYVGIALSSQFSTLLSQAHVSDSLDEIISPMISNPSFLKNVAHFNSFSTKTKARIEKAWGYSSNRENALVLGCDLFDSVSYAELGRYCGTCEVMPLTFHAALYDKLEDPKATTSILVKIGREPVGLVKNQGDRSFLALRNVRNTQGRLILVKGGVYATHESIGPSNSGPTIDLNNRPENERLFYPLTFMRSLDGPFTKQEFKEFISILDVAVASWRSEVTSPRTSELTYLRAWKEAQDKDAYLLSLDSQNLLLLMRRIWNQLPNREAYLNRLNSKSLAVIVIEKWDSLMNPESHLQQLAEEELVEVLTEKWESLSEPEPHLQRLTEHDVGKVLVRNWKKIRDPESILRQRISDPYLRDMILRLKESGR